MQKPPSPPISDQIKAAEAQAFKPLAFVAKTALPFFSFDFGIRAINPLMLISAPIVFAIYHDAINLFGRLGDPPFSRSYALPFVEAFEIVTLCQILFSWLTYWRGRPQMSHFLGTPFLTLLKVPFRLAWLINIGIVFVAGMQLRRLDHALGLWVMFAAAGMTMCFAYGVRQQTNDQLDMMDAQFSLGNVQSAVKKRREPAARPAASEDLPTGI